MTSGVAAIDGSWVVLEFLVDDNLRKPMEGSTLTLEILDGRVGGSGGINRFMGAFAEGDLVFGPLATTMMAGPLPLMDQETAYLGLLARADSATVESGSLVLSAHGTALVVLERAGTRQSSKTSDTH